MLLLRDTSLPYKTNKLYILDGILRTLAVLINLIVYSFISPFKSALKFRILQGIFM